MQTGGLPTEIQGSDFELTQTIQNLALPAYPSEYWVGYALDSIISDYFKPTEWALTQNQFIFSKVEGDSVHNVGYISSHNYNFPYASYAWISNNLLIIKPSNSWRFINKLTPSTSGISRTVSLSFFVASILTPEDSARNLYYSSIINQDVDLIELRDGSTQVIFTVNLGSNAGDFVVELSKDDLGTKEFEGEQNGFHFRLRVYLIGFRFNFLSPICPIAVADMGTYKAILGGGAMSSGYWGIYLQSDGITPYVNDGLLPNGWLPFGIDFKVTREFFNNMPDDSEYANGTGVLMRRSASSWILYRILTFDDVYNTASLQVRVTLGRAAGFSNDIYYPKMSGNQFVGDLINGELEEIKDELEDWQETELSTDTNEYKEEDKPEPEPPSDQDDKDVDPEEDPGEIPDNEGESPGDCRDRIIFAPSEFLTQYILDSTRLRTFGSRLWTTWLDGDSGVWRNFMFALGTSQDTGTFDIASALQMIVSLRVFPFSLTGAFFNQMSSSTGLYMGTGHTDFLGTEVAVLNGLMGWLNAGECVVKPSDGATYNDFRDIYNTSVSVFLPYCGTVELNPADVMFKKLSCRYYIDFQSGGCTAIVDVHDDESRINYPVASKSGQIGFLLPVTATNAGQVTGQFVNDALNAASLIGNNIFSDARTIGNSVIGMLGSGATTSKSKSSDSSDAMAWNAALSMGQSNFNTALSLAGEANDIMARSGIGIPTLSGGAGITAMQFSPRAYVQIRRGKYKVPKKYGHNVGYRSSTYQRVGSYTGFTVFSGVDVSGLDCTEEEQMKIKAIMESGIYVTNDK